MIRRRSAIALCALATSLSSSGCFLIYPDFNGDGAVTIEDFDVLIAGCGMDGGMDDGPPDDAPPVDGVDEDPMSGDAGM